MSDVEATEEVKKKRSKKAILIPVIVLVLGLGGGGFVFLGGAKKGDAAKSPAKTTTTLPGPIIRLDPITLNLTDGHVLKVGLALEALAAPKDKEVKAVVAELTAAPVEGATPTANPSPMGGLEAKALDLAITELGNRSYVDLSDPKGRLEAKETLQKEIVTAYHGDIVEIYFTSFVMS